mgnify:CR=1 FL=1
MEIEDHIIKNIKFLNSPNFNERPENTKISLIVIHSISLPPNVYGNSYVEDVKREIENKDSEIIIISAKIESEINELDSVEEKKIFLMSH